MLSYNTYITSLLLNNGFKFLLPTCDEVILHARHELANITSHHSGITFRAL